MEEPTTQKIQSFKIFFQFISPSTVFFLITYRRAFWTCLWPKKNLCAIDPTCQNQLLANPGAFTPKGLSNCYHNKVRIVSQHSKINSFAKFHLICTRFPSEGFGFDGNHACQLF